MEKSSSRLKTSNLRNECLCSIVSMLVSIFFVYTDCNVSLGYEALVDLRIS